MPKPDIAAFFDPRTHSVQYVVSDPQTKACAIIDPVLDFDEKLGSTATQNADALLDHVRDQQLALQWILDTADQRLPGLRLVLSESLPSKLFGRL